MGNCRGCEQVNAFPAQTPWSRLLGVAHLERRDVGKGDIDDQHARPTLGGPHVTHLQGYGAFHMTGHQHTRHDAGTSDQAKTPLTASNY